MLKKTALYALVLTLALGLAVAGCKKDEEEILPEGDMPAGMGTGSNTMPQVPNQVMIPPDVAKTWKSVVLEVTDKDTREAKTYEIKIGGTAPLGNTGLTAFVEAFLPHFSMQGEAFTSVTNELNNPAARVKITDKDGKELFFSFLFALYPDTHPFDHPKYKVILKDYKKN